MDMFGGTQPTIPTYALNKDWRSHLNNVDFKSHYYSQFK